MSEVDKLSIMDPKRSTLFSGHSSIDHSLPFQPQQSCLNTPVTNYFQTLPYRNYDLASASYQCLSNNAKSSDGLVNSNQSGDDPDPFSDPVLKYINDMLMDEDMEGNQSAYQEYSALQATVKPFYDILGERYPPCPPLESSSSSSVSSYFSQLPSTSTQIHTEGSDRALIWASSSTEIFCDIQKEVLQSGTQSSPKKKLQESKRQGKKKEAVDLRALLIHCAQAVARNDNRGAQEILKQIRQHSCPQGDGTLRLAHYFAESLVARLSGTGGRLYTRLASSRPSAAELRKAYHLHMVASPFIEASIFFSVQTILDVAENASCLHIVDFGILYGLQWPSLIQRLSTRRNGPPKLRITGIDFAQCGLRAAERIEEIGRRLTDYARSCGVPFEYEAIATKWESIDPEDLASRNEEVLIVNCLYRMKHLMDETVIVESPRNIVLRKIRRMNPQVFIHGVVNGQYNAPFYVTRFREALFHYSAQFDVLETTVPHDHPERIVIEREIWGRQILNVVACEGLERIERPEAYKQWQVRIQRSGFVQLNLNQEILSTVRERTKSFYHKDFGVDADGKWMLLGWKGRIIYSLSTWRPSK